MVFSDREGCEKHGLPARSSFPQVHEDYVIYSLSSLMGNTYGVMKGAIIGVITGETRSLDYRPHHYSMLGFCLGPPYLWKLSSMLGSSGRDIYTSMYMQRTYRYLFSAYLRV